MLILDILIQFFISYIYLSPLASHNTSTLHHPISSHLQLLGLLGGFNLPLKKKKNVQIIPSTLFFMKPRTKGSDLAGSLVEHPPCTWDTIHRSTKDLLIPFLTWQAGKPQIPPIHPSQMEHPPSNNLSIPNVGQKSGSVAVFPQSASLFQKRLLSRSIFTPKSSTKHSRPGRISDV